MALQSYGPTAYRSSALPQLPPAAKKYADIFNASLRWGNYAGLEPVTEIERQLETKRHTWLRQQKGLQRTLCDAERWRFEDTSRIPSFLLVIKLACFFLPLIIFGIEIGDILDDSITPFIGLFLACTSLYLSAKKRHIACSLTAVGAIITAILIAWDQSALWGYWSERILFWLGIFLFLMALFGADALLWLYRHVHRHDDGFERRTGMLRIARRWRKTFVAPFYEFDPLMQAQSSPHGDHHHALWLHHRYTGIKVCLAGKVHSRKLDKPNLLAFWDTLQRYMDVEQPLPELPILEPSRHLDPLTAAHDAATMRPPRRWCDTTAEQWAKRERQKLLQQLNAYPWQQRPCLLRTHIDPQLSIETYRRQQQAKGIQLPFRSDT